MSKTGSPSVCATGLGALSLFSTKKKNKYSNQDADADSAAALSVSGGWPTGLERPDCILLVLVFGLLFLLLLLLGFVRLRRRY